MREVSCTVTCGKGSERHNHDLEYRSTLEHVHERPEGVIELVPYRPYKEQINEAIKPYIDEYNARVDQRYQEAWERYNEGVIKTKPRKRDYKHMEYDYYEEHKDDQRKNPHTGKMEEVPIYRSMIIGIGDQSDRERVSELEARKVFEGTVDQFRKDFPDFVILGATMHLDEQGFYHMHLDYKPLYEREDDKGLGVGVGLDGALQRMGYTPEQSIINERDKAPILFNAMRNKIYYNVEEQLNKQNIMLQYGVSRTKEPEKDSSTNQRLENWQETQDLQRSMQHDLNTFKSVMASPSSPEAHKEAVQAFYDIEYTMRYIEASPRSRLHKDEMRVSFRLFDQLRSFLNRLREQVAQIFKRNEELGDEYERMLQEEYVPREDYERLERRMPSPQQLIDLGNAGSLQRENDALRQKVNEYERQLGISKGRGRSMDDI